MKKRCDWVTKEKKRKKKQKDRGIVDFIMIQNHFFAALPQWIDEMPKVQKEPGKKKILIKFILNCCYIQNSPCIRRVNML